MATYVKYEHFIEALCNAEVIAWTTTNLWQVAIHSDAPTVATDDELADLTQITGTGYTAKGKDLQNDGTRSGGVVSVAAVDIVWTATAADWTTGRYLSAHDDTSTTDILVASWDYGSNFTVGDGETFTADFTTNIFTIS